MKKILLTILLAAAIPEHIALHYLISDFVGLDACYDEYNQFVWCYRISFFIWQVLMIILQMYLCFFYLALNIKKESLEFLESNEDGENYEEEDVNKHNHPSIQGTGMIIKDKI